MQLNLLFDNLHNSAYFNEKNSRMVRPALNDLVAFQCIANLRSFRRAALALNVSASALSHSMRHLEAQLGLRLLQRNTRSVGLTEAGQALLQQIKPALEQINQALDQLNDFRATPHGTLRLNVPAHVAQWVLAPHFAAFLKHYPNIHLEVVCQDALVDIVAAGFDAGIRFEENLQQDMIAFPLVSHLAFALVAAPAYIQQYGLPQTVDALTQHHALHWRFSNGEYYEWELTQNSQLTKVHIQGQFASNDSVLLLEAARQGLGIAYLFKTQVQADLEQGTLIELLKDYTLRDLTLYLYYPSRKQSTCLKAFIEYWRQNVTNYSM